MIAFSEISQEARYMLAALFFLTFVSLLIVSVHQFIRHKNRIRGIVDGILSMGLLIFCSLLSSAAKTSIYIAIPWITVPILAVSVYLYIGAAVRRGYRRHSKTFVLEFIKRHFGRNPSFRLQKRMCQMNDEK